MLKPLSPTWETFSHSFWNALKTWRQQQKGKKLCALWSQSLRTRALLSNLISTSHKFLIWSLTWCRPRLIRTSESWFLDLSALLELWIHFWWNKLNDHLTKQLTPKMSQKSSMTYLKCLLKMRTMLEWGTSAHRRCSQNRSKIWSQLISRCRTSLRLSRNNVCWSLLRNWTFQKKISTLQWQYIS